MAGRAENSIISESALQALDSSPDPTRTGRATNPVGYIFVLYLMYIVTKSNMYIDSRVTIYDM